MPLIRFEVNRGDGWQQRSGGDLRCTMEVLLRELRLLTIQYPHRLFVNGHLVASSKPVIGRPSAPEIMRHDTTARY